jgi:two-component system sensor histidine kinase ChvG
MSRWHLTTRLAKAPTRIATRLLLFNVLLVFLPVAGLLYLSAYERHLLEQQERAMTDAGRIMAAALSDGPLDAARAALLTTHLAQATDARFRVVNRDRHVLADSHAGQTRDPGTIDLASAYSPSGSDPVRTSWLYRTGAALGRGIRQLFATPPPVPGAETIVVAPDLIVAPEVDRALGGAYGAATRLSPGGQRSVTLYSALPIRAGPDVVGVVLVSQSTWRILQRIYDVRLRMFTVVVISLGFAVGLMAVASLTIVAPLRRLRDDAESLADRRGRLVRRFRGVERRDEIGELARALDDLTGRLEAHLRFTERFSADVTHEFRNPLASIRASAETLADAERPEDRERFRAHIERDISRLEHLLRGVRDLTSVDAQLEEEQRSDVDLGAVVRECVGERDVAIDLRLPEPPLVVEASAERLRQIVDNLLDNAASFSPAGSRIEITGEAHDRTVSLRVRDHGPGIADDHLPRIFDRFFCHRPEQPDARQQHTGLGLPIALTIAQSYGGHLRAFNHPEGGAVFELTLPLARH